MPELPEVEVTARSLRSGIAGAMLLSVQYSGQRLRHPFPRQAVDRLCGQVLRAIDRRAKYLLFEFDAGWLAIHLGMSGTMQACDADALSRTHDHVRLRFRLPAGQTQDIVFHDPRRFGSFQWISRADVPSVDMIGQILGQSASGIEPFDPRFDGEWLFHASRGKTTAIKQWLMNGHCVVGVGNIYACEALYASQIHPKRAAGVISRARYTKLASSIRHILADAITAGGSTISDFVGADGQAGRYGQAHSVYGREGESCPRCVTQGRPDATIHRMVQQQRSTFYCRACQR